MKFLREWGWEVFRTAGSHTHTDILAFKKDHKPLWVQCKASEYFWVDPVDINVLFLGEKFYDVTVLGISRNKRKLVFHVLEGRKFTEVERPVWLA
jgi:Holliday junction resolvase